MLRLVKANVTWWRKPLVLVDGRCLPAELAVLSQTLRDGEDGAWINSRGTDTAAVDLIRRPDGKFATVRAKLPDFVQERLKSFYDHPEVAKGVFDLVIWHISDKKVRFVEVKCPHWDRPTPEQKRFAELANEWGIETHIAEWEFVSGEGTP